MARRWTIHSTHPAATQHPPDPHCENCDGCGCMDCVMRRVHDKCEDNCPICCEDNFESVAIDVTAVADIEDLAAEFDRRARQRIHHLQRDTYREAAAYIRERMEDT